MAKNGNGEQDKVNKLADLRDKIEAERARREAIQREAAAAKREAELDAEVVRLEAQLEAEKALTKQSTAEAEAPAKVVGTTEEKI